MLWILALGGFFASLLYTIYPVISFFYTMTKISKNVADIPAAIGKFHWLLGNLPYFPGPCEEGLMMNVEFMKKYPKYYKFWYSRFHPVIVLNHPDLIRQLFKSLAPKSLNISGGYRMASQWFGDGLLVSSGKKWARNRRLLTPGFHFDILKPYMNIYNQCTQVMLSHLAKLDGSVDIFKPASLLSLEVVLKCAFSYNESVQSTDKAASPYVEAVTTMNHLILHRLFNPLLHFDFIYYKTKNGKEFAKKCQISHQVAQEVIARRKHTLQELGEEKLKASKKYIDFLDILLLARDEEGHGLSDEDIQAEVETFMFEGHDTTKSALSYILYNLARHPEIQKAAQEEIDQLLIGRESDEILWDDLGNMPYLTKCIKESMRLHPAVPFILRALDKPYTIDGHEYLPDTIFEIYIWNVHHNPEVWGDDHMTYDPERFNEEKTKEMNPYAFIPFSAGPRNCIGQNFAMNEVKVTVARCLKRFKITVDPKVKVELRPEVVLTAKNGIYLNFDPRN